MYGRILLTYFIFISNNNLPFVQTGRTWGIPRYRYYIQRANFGTKTLSYILLLSNFLFKICTSIHHMVLDPVTPKESPFDEQNHLALDRVKSIKSLLSPPQTRDLVIDNLKLSTTKKHSLWRKLSTTKSQIISCRQLSSFPFRKGNSLVVDN